MHSLKLCIINGQSGTNGCNLFALLFVNEADARADCYESGFIRSSNNEAETLYEKRKKITHSIGNSFNLSNSPKPITS